MAKYICDKISAAMIINGQPKLIERDDVTVEIKQPRNIKHHKKYWKLMEFTAFNAPEWCEMESGEDVHELIKNRLGTKVFTPDGKLSHTKPASIKFTNMEQLDFEQHYSKALDICAKIIGVTPESVINELTGFF